MIEKVYFDGFEFIEGGVCAAKGFKANGIQCGLAHKPLGENESNHGHLLAGTKKKNDLAMIQSDSICNAAAVYTTNLVKGAPILVTKEHLKNGKAQAVIVNSVNANTCNPDGVEKATRMAELCAEALSVSVDDVIVASTGVIGQPLPIEPIEKAMGELSKGMAYDGNDEALEAIMTTDIMGKEIAVSFTIDGKECHLGGMLKGSGMIHPNMATTLTFLTSDVAISSELIQKALSVVIKTTLNCVSVDGDTSTNDMVCVMANGMAGNKEITSEEDEAYGIFYDALFTIMINLSRMMARDGEGATKLIECTVTGTETFEDAVKIAKSIIMSSLVKAMVYGKDANCGRLLCAIGYAGVDLDVNHVDVVLYSEFGELPVCKNGCVLEFDEALAAKIFEAEEIDLDVWVGDGEASAFAWGCDLTYDYVKINGDYRS